MQKSKKKFINAEVKCNKMCQFIADYDGVNTFQDKSQKDLKCKNAKKAFKNQQNQKDFLKAKKTF